MTTINRKGLCHCAKPQDLDDCDCDSYGGKTKSNPIESKEPGGSPAVGGRELSWAYFNLKTG